MRKSTTIVFLLLTIAGAALAADAPPYVDRNGWFGVMLDREPREGGGIRVQSTVEGGPAAEGGLRAGDVILSIRGETIADFETLARVIASTEPGTGVAVEVRRGEETVTLTVTVGHRKQALGVMVEGGRETFHGPEEIHPGWDADADAFSKRLEALLEKEGKRSLLDDLVAAFGRDEDLYESFYKLDEVSYARRRPLHLPRLARALTDGFREALARGDDALVRRAAEALDESLPAGAQDPAANPAEVLEGLAFARGLVDRALRGLSGGERAFLFRQAGFLAEKFEEHIYLQVNSSQTMLDNNLQAIRLSKKIDYGLLFLAGAEAARLADAVAAIGDAEWTAFAKERGLQRDDLATGDVLAAFDADAGPVVIGGPGRTVYTGAVALAVDLGGDDVWLNNAGGSTNAIPVAVAVDRSGADTYRGNVSCQGAGRLGAGVLLDLQGDDVYEARRLSQGCGLAGVGLLRDRAGDDRYNASAYHAGAALFGIGVLADDAGDDRYAANLYSQGFGATKGMGLTIDASGSDTYYASGKHPSSYGTPGVYRGMSQGFGIGFRSFAAGGIGTLLDLGGNDHYVAGNFSQGGGYFLSLGILHDAFGDDRYDASRYNQGFGVHSAAGILLDDAGDDRYRCEVAANQGSAWDLGVGWLVDGAGDDRYEAHGLSQGGSSQNGFSVLLDLGGKDDYFARGNGQGFGGATEYGGGRGAKNLGILMDAGGGKDAYNKDGRKNGETRVDEKGGVFADLEGGLADREGAEEEY